MSFSNDECNNCGNTDWINMEEMARVTGQEGGVYEVIQVLTCRCGHQQKA
jgi:anaerobic ribonucleoside-triphosphate reductase|tara:strand:+ start:400 stop:549 length:150 start_codon:yes stop_codon:yes gene_type:complete